MVVWPFKPRTPMLERMQWLTDVIQARIQEQRISLREEPRVWLEMEHELTDQQYQIARNIARDFLQFYVPFWPDRTETKDIEDIYGFLWNGDIFWQGFTPWAGPDVCAHKVKVDYCGYFPSADRVMFWGAWDSFEDVNIIDAGDTYIYTLPTALSSYKYVVPVFLADVPDGVRGTRRPGGPQQVKIMALLRGARQPQSGSPVDTYKGHEIITECPKLGAGGTGNPISFALDSFEENIGLPEYSARRNYPEALYSWKWIVTEPCELRKFMARCKGSQKAFWVSDFLHNYVPTYNISGTDLYIEDAGYVGERFHIEIVTTTNTYRRYVTDVEETPYGLKLTLDASVTATKENIIRISRLHLVRLNSDEVVFSYVAGLGTTCSAVLAECPIF